MAIDTTPELAFSQLRQLRATLSDLYLGSVAALTAYFDPPSGGFYHLIEPDDEKIPGDFSKASSATVVNFLTRSGLWERGPWKDGATSLADAIFKSEWSSAGLPEGNPFTKAFLVEVLASLAEVGAVLGDDGNERIFNECAFLNRELKKHGGIGIDPHPPTAYLTQLAVRTLRRWRRLDRASVKAVQEWAKGNLDRELVILQASPTNSDVFEIAYSVILLQSLEIHAPRTRSDIVVQRDVVHYAIRAFFDRQEADGSWPRSRPLFNYPKVGSAYCFDYELLVQMLGERSLWPLLLRHLPGLKRAVENLEKLKHPIADGAYAWASGHHRQLRSPESWSTASVLHFCYELNRLVAEATRRAVFAEVGAPYREPGLPGTARAKLPADFLDSGFSYRGRRRSLKRVLERDFLGPLIRERDEVSRGRSFSKDTPISAILHGAPGTSKTRLATLIATSLQWPLLKVDPSFLVRQGFDNVQAETNRLFDFLFEAEEMVVLFDEIDELVRERGSAWEASSRFLTTAMLPKWTALSDIRKIVYLVATNHLEEFDAAISRPGRFDVILPVTTPTAEAKLAAWGDVKTRVDALNLTGDRATKKKLELLSYAEFKSVADDLAQAENITAFMRVLDDAVTNAIVNQPSPPLPSEDADGARTWQQVVEAQKTKTRLP